MAMVEVRQIAPDDAQAVSALVTQLGYDRTPAQIATWIAGADPARQAAFVAVVDGVVAGWIEIERVHHLQSEPFVLIGGLVVQDGLRGMGVGRDLCRRAEQWAWDHGVETVRVTSRSTRLDAHRFYLRDGYELSKTSLVFEKRRNG